ncbi:MAG: argininosuccinate synthase [Candidatus Omnitrophota bacterium]
MGKKVVLAYSGGLDTSCAIKWFAERGFSIVAYMADVGQESNYSAAKKRALATGASKVIVDDLKKEFVKDFVFPSLQANAVYESEYFLATALSRPLIAKGLVQAANREKAAYVAHGCTGKGNDQIRFEVTVAALDPKLITIAPVREWELKSRPQEIRYAKKHRIPIDVTKKKPYSLDVNLWGVSIEGGKLEDPAFEPPEDIYRITASVRNAPAQPAYVEIYFDRGVPKKLNGKALDGVSLIQKLGTIAGANGVGRSDMIESRLVGIKSREIYEAPAATVLFAAHKALEAMVLDRELLHFKESIALKYAEMVYYGLWYTRLKEALDAFVARTQRIVTGTVRLKLHKGNCIVVGRTSPRSLYSEKLATYGEGDQFDQTLAKGFIELFGLPYKGSFKESYKR